MADDRYYVYTLNPHPTTATVWVGTWHPDTVGDSELWLITSAGSKRIAAYDAPDVEDDFSTIGAAAPTIPVLAEAPLGACHFTTKRITRLSPHTAYRVEWRRSDGTVLASARFVTLPRGLATADMPALTEPAVIAPGGSSPPGQAAIGGLASGPGRMGVAPGGAFSGGGAAPEVAGERRGEAIPVRPETEHTLTVLTGSCFWYRGATNELERLAAYLAAQGLLPDMTFLTGDQVYVDQTPADDWIIPKSDDALERFVTRRYWSTWRRLIDVLAMGSNIMITDDHEFWNDYPYEPLGLVWPALQSETYRNKVEDVTQRFVAAVQQSPVVQQIDVGSDLSFFVADTRRKRTKPDPTIRNPIAGMQLLSRTDFNKLIRWIQRLICPGVLVTSQPLLAEATESKLILGTTDANIPSYFVQYRDLLAAIKEAPHDILVVSGDIHVGRLVNVSWQQPNGRQAKLYELTASPIRLLQGSDDEWSPETIPARLPAHPSLGPDIGMVDVMATVPSVAGDRVDHMSVLQFNKTAAGVTVDTRAISLAGVTNEYWMRQFTLS